MEVSIFKENAEIFVGSEEQMENLYNEIEVIQALMSPDEDATIDIYVDLLLPTIRRIIKEKCNGCVIDHPSQMQHDVCTMTPFDRSVRLYWEEALGQITAFEVNRIAKNKKSLMKAFDVPMEDSYWRSRWKPLAEARVVLNYFWGRY